MIKLVRTRLALEEGQALIEYALILALITILAVGGLTMISDQVTPFFSNIGSAIKF
jgi:Flp pilus assembly pilin Flp